MRQVFTASVFIMFEEKVLLIHHNLLDKWLPVGGEIEQVHEDLFETPMEAAYREALEETGISVTFDARPDLPSGTPAGLIGYEEHSAGPKGLHMNFCFLGRAISVKGACGRIVGLEPGEGFPTPISDGSWNNCVWVNPKDKSSYAGLVMPQNVRDLLGVIDGILMGNAIRAFNERRPRY